MIIMDGCCPASTRTRRVMDHEMECNNYLCEFVKTVECSDRGLIARSAKTNQKQKINKSHPQNFNSMQETVLGVQAQRTVLSKTGNGNLNKASSILKIFIDETNHCPQILNFF